MQFKSGLMASVAVAFALVAPATEYYWDGLSSYVWDTTTATWLVDNAGTVVPFVSGNVMKVTKGTGAASSTAANKITFAQQVKPSEFIYDSSQDMTMDIQTSGVTGRADKPFANVSKFVKRGTGSLMVYKNNTQNGELGVPAATTIEVEQGALKFWTRNSSALGVNGNTIHIHSGAEFWSCMYSSLGNPYATEAQRHNIILGGTLKLQDNGGTAITEQIRTLALEGGTVSALTTGNPDYGVLGVYSDIYVTNKTTGCQTLTVTRSNSADAKQRITLNPVTPVTLHVDDVATGDDLIFDTVNADTAGISLLNGDKSELTHGVVKVGAGTMRLTANANAFNIRTFDIREGRFELPRAQNCIPNTNFTVRVHPGATFCIPMRNTVSPGYGCGWLGEYQKQKYHILGGTFIVGDTAWSASDGVNGSCYIGDELVLSNATFVCNLGKGTYPHQNRGIYLGRLLAFDGMSPYVLPAGGYPWALQSSSYGGTEIRVADITKDDTVDVTIAQRFYDNVEQDVYGPTGAWKDRPSGFTKTGPGTLKFTNRYNAQTGDCEIREGTVVYQSEAPGDVSGTVFGKVNANRSLTVKTGATLIDEDANLGYYYDPLANAKPINGYLKLAVRLEGGKLLLRNVKDAAKGNGCCWLYGPFVFKNGGFIEYDDPNGGNSYGQIAVSAVSVEDAETAAVHEIPKNPDSAANQNLYLYDTNLVFNIADSSHDSRVDLKVGLNPSVRLAAEYVADGGFIKRGAGTLSFNGPAASTYASAPKGTVKVEAGTLLVDAAWGFHQLAGLVVSSGAAIGGTGAVNTLTLAAGANLAATLGQAKGLSVSAGKVTLPASGTVVLNVPADVTDEQLEEAKSFNVVEVPGGLEGAANIANWTVSIPGHEDMAARFRLTANNNRVRCCGPRGMLILFR